jgi:RimJ/RimL family protein N-acetyltransferase
VGSRASFGVPFGGGGQWQRCRLVRVNAGVFTLCVSRRRGGQHLYDAAFARRGIGTRLLNALTEQADQQGIWTLESSIFANNEVSIRLHERCGFRLVGVREKLGKDAAGVWRDTVLMEKRSSKIN